MSKARGSGVARQGSDDVHEGFGVERDGEKGEVVLERFGGILWLFATIRVLEVSIFYFVLVAILLVSFY